MMRGTFLRGSLFAGLFLTSASLSTGLQICPNCAPPQIPPPPKMATPTPGTPVTVLPAPLMPCPRPLCPMTMPTMPPGYVAPAVMIPQEEQHDDAAAQNAIKNFRKNLEPGQKVVLVQTLCVQVPAGFCEQAGLGIEPGHGGCGPWVLTPRESKMFGALLRATTNK